MLFILIYLRPQSLAQHLKLVWVKVLFANRTNNEQVEQSSDYRGDLVRFSKAYTCLLRAQ